MKQIAHAIKLEIAYDAYKAFCRSIDLTTCMNRQEWLTYVRGKAMN